MACCFPKICADLRKLGIVLFSLTTAFAQPEPLAPSATPFEETIKPTWETQKQARTYVLDIPAPRG